jgi:biotin carboxylase
MKNFLLIEHGGKFKSFTLDVAKDKNLNLFIATSKPEEWLYDYVKKENIILTNTDNITELIFSLSIFMKERNISFSGVGTFFEDFVTQTAEVANILGLVGCPIKSAYSSSRNKLIMRDICRTKNIATQPDYEIFHITDKSKIKLFLCKYKNIVLKPIYGGSSVGVIKVSSDTNLDTLLEDTLLEIQRDPDNTFKNYNNFFLLEEYLEGEVISIDGIIQNKNILFIGETQFYLGQEPKFIQIGGITPTSLNIKELKEAKKITSEILFALDFNNCGFHCELRLTKDGPKLIEIASRLPGGPIQINYNLAYEINSTSMMYDLWLGKKLNPKIIEYSNKYIIYKNIYTKITGKIKEIIIPEYIYNVVSEIMVLVKETQYVVSGEPYPTLLYYYSIEAESKEHAEHLSQKIESEIKFIPE